MTRFLLFFSLLISTFYSHAQNQEDWHTNGDWMISNPSTSAVWWYTIHYYDKNLVFVGGSGGNIGRSTDGGESWEFINTGIDFGIQSIEFISDKVGWVAGGQGTVLKTIDGGITWEKQQNEQFEAIDYSQDIHFVNEDVGYLCGKLLEGSGFIYKTIDGGSTWTSINSTDSFASFFMLMLWEDQNVGWLASSQYELYKTTDGGQTWQVKRAADPSWGVIRHLNFFENTGFVVTAEGFVEKTIDGGETWLPTNDSIDVDFTFMGYDPPWVVQGAYFIDSDKGFAVDDDENIYMTTDGGDSWSDPIPEGDGSFFFSIEFFDEENGLAVGRTGLILRTEDGGDTWENLRNSTRNINDIKYVGLTGFSAGDGGSIFKYTGAQNAGWTMMTTNSEADLLALAFTGENEGWAVGTYGTLLHTDDLGETWETRSLGSVSSLNDIVVSTGGTGLIVGDLEDSVFLSTDQGVTWDVVNTGVTTALNAIGHTPLEDAKLWVVGDDGIILSSNNSGSSWEAQASNTEEHLNDIFFVNDTLGWIVGDSSTILHTVDGGDSWSKQNAPVSYYEGTSYPPPSYIPTPVKVPIHLNSVSFVDDQIGYAVGSTNDGSATIIHTTDGGDNWQLLEDHFNVGATLNTTYFSGLGSGWVGGQNGWIVHYSNDLPYIKEITPLSIAVGETVNISGYNFSDIASVVFGDTEVNFNIIDDHSISAEIPDIQGPVYVSLSNEAGTIISASQIEIMNPLSLDNDLPVSPALYPNPTSRVVYLTNFESTVGEISLLDQNGRTVKRFFEYERDMEKIGLDITGITPGLYLINIVSEAGQNTHRIIIQ